MKKECKHQGIRFKQYLACLLVSALLITGCSTESGSANASKPQAVPSAEADSSVTPASSSGSPEEPVTVRIATYTIQDPAKAYLTEYIEKELGIILDWQVYSRDSFSTQFSLMLATGDLPDLFVGSNISKQDINKYGADGYLLDMTAYLEYMPNLSSLIENYPLWAAYQKDEGGAIYGLSRLFPSRIGLATGMGTFINKEWLENVGMDIPSTVDELYAVLKAFKEKDANGNGDPNDEIPLGIQLGSSGRGTRFEWMLLSAFGFYTNNPEMTFHLDDSGSVRLVQQEDSYREYLKFLNKLYEEGLMEPSAFIITDEERIDKTANDKYGVFCDWAGLTTAIGGKYDGNPYEKYAYISALTSEYNDRLMFGMGNCGYAGDSRTYINADTDHPEEIARLIDFFLSPEGTTIADYGKESETFAYIEDTYGNRLPSFINGYTADTVRLDEAFKLIRTTDVNSIVEAAADDILDRMIYEDDTFTYTASAAIEKELRKMDELIPPFPDLTFSGEDSNTYSTLSGDVTNIIKTYKSSFILGEMDIDTNWQKFQSDMETAGLAQMLTIVTEAYKTFMANQ